MENSIPSKISVVIPTLNEAECIEPVLKELPHDMLHEVLVVDGGSTDGTQELVEKLGFKVIQQEGRGYGMAVSTGLKHCTGDLVTFFDADGSYDPAAFPELLKGVQAGNDVVFCSRYLPESGSDDDTWIRALGNWFFTFLMRWWFGVRLSDSLFLYCLIRKEVFNSFPMSSKSFDWCIEFPIKVERAGFKYKEIPSKERPRIGGDSKVHAFHHGLEILWLLIKFKLTNAIKVKPAPVPNTP